MDTDSSSNSVNLKHEKTILNFSFMGSVIFLLAEVAFSIITHSKAILMDCVYDVADLIMIGPFMVLIPYLYRPVTEKRPYGYSQVESFFVLIKYSLLLSVEFYLILSCIDTIIHGGNNVEATTIAGFEIAVSVGCIIMYLFLNKLVKKYSTPSVKAELFIWKLDAISTMGVGLAFLLCIILERSSLAFISPYVDPCIAIIVAVALAKEPLAIIFESFRSLMLFAPKKDLFNRVQSICEEVFAEYDCTVNFTDVIKTGRKLWVQIYFSHNKNVIDIARLKAANAKMKDLLSAEFGDVYLELTPDMDEGFRHVKPATSPLRRKDKIDYLESKEYKKANKKTKNTLYK